jgi:Tol biopolymer transport system component
VTASAALPQGVSFTFGSDFNQSKDINSMRLRVFGRVRSCLVLVAAVAALATASCAARGSKGRPLLITGKQTDKGEPGGRGSQVVRLDADGAGRKALTPGEDYCADPALSPDGKRVAFVAIDRDAKRSEVWVMNADGTGRERLVAKDRVEGDDAIAPNWSPDGKRIAFSAVHYNPVRGSRPPRLYLVDADGRNLKRIGKVEGAMPVWSPDGRRLLFMGSENKEVGLFTTDVDGSDVRPLVEGATMGAWSPDGERLAYVVIRGGGAGLFVARADGSEPKRLAGGPDETVFGVQWSADGRGLFFTRQGPGEAVPGEGDWPGGKRTGGERVPPPPAVHAIDVDGENSRKLTAGDEPEYLGGSYFWASFMLR